MKTIKGSLENLRAILPSAAKLKTMSQLETLKQAVDYIKCLKAKLIEGSDQNSTTSASGMSDLENYVKDPTTAFDSQGPKNEPIHMDFVSATAASEPEVGSVVLTSTPFSKIEKIEATSTSDPASMASAASHLSSTTSGMSDLEKYVKDPTTDFDSQVFENFVVVDNPPEQAVILNFDLTKLEEYSVDGPSTSGSAQSISGSGNQVQVAVPADTPQVAPQLGKRSIFQTFWMAQSCTDSLFL